MVRDGRAEERFYFEIFLVAMSLILLEISFTRIFSYKVFYYFTYLIIGISLLGLGSGGIFVAIVPWLRNTAPHRLVPLLCMVGAVSTFGSYLAAALIQLNASALAASPFEIFKLAVLGGAMFVPFLAAGIVLSTIFAARPEQMGRLYFVDLIGAGVGCGLVVYLLRALTPPGCVMLCALLLAIAGLRLAWSEWRWLVPLGVVSSVVALAGMLAPNRLPDPVTDRGKTMSPQMERPQAKIVHSEWNPVFRVDVLGFTSKSIWAGRHHLIHDGNIGSSILEYDGDLKQLAFLDSDPRSTPFAVLDPDPSVLIIGAAGGQEVLASLYFGASEITGVELNPVTTRIMRGKFAEFSGNIMNHPRVTLVNAEGRNYVSQMEQPVDLIWLVAPDSYSAMNAASAGAFVLSESYLYTVEMVIESLGRLSDRGILCAQFGEIHYGDRPKRTARYLATAREAFRRLGIGDFERHVLVGTTPDFLWPMATIVLKPKPFTRQEVLRFRDNFRDLDLRLATKKGLEGPTGEDRFRERPVIWHAAGGPTDVSGRHPVNKVISLPDAALEDWYASFEYSVSPITDNRPFFWHFVRFRDALTRNWGEGPAAGDPEEATGERVLITLLAFSAVFAAALMLLPLFAIRDVWGLIPHKTAAGVYFSALGLGFMFFEISLIQQLTLFLGYPTHSLTVTLFSLLTFTGIGSLATDHWVRDRNRSLVFLLLALFGLMLWYQFGLAPVVNHLAGLRFPLRVAFAIVFVAPLGLCLGSFMPIGINAVAQITEHKQQLVAWCWAVNGFFSVVASVLTTILAMSVGFRWVLLASVVIYAIGVLAMTRIPKVAASS
jgi:MFS family permease